MSSIESINPRKYAVYRRHNLQITWRNRIFVVLLPSNKFQVGAINSLCQILDYAESQVRKKYSAHNN